MKSAKKSSPLPDVAYYHQTVATPVGYLQIIASDEGIREMRYVDGKVATDHPSELTARAAQAVRDFMAGTAITWNLPLDVARGSELQRKVWRALEQVPYGTTISYSELAARVGAPNAVRAVGSACGKNPLPLIVPCHRIVAKGGGLGGFAWGLDAKRWLLDLEAQKHINAA